MLLRYGRSSSSFIILMVGVNYLLRIECSFLVRRSEQSFALRKPTFDSFFRRKLFSIVDSNKRKQQQHLSRSSTSLSRWSRIMRGGSDTSYSDNEEEEEKDYIMENSYEDVEAGKSHDDQSALPLSLSSSDEGDTYNEKHRTGSHSSSTEIYRINEEKEVHVRVEKSAAMNSPCSSVSTEAKSRKSSRHTSDMILELNRRSSVSNNDESLVLRHLVTSRTADYINELQETVAQFESDDELIETVPNNDVNIKLPHPRSLLHFLSKNVPAIKQSPDVNLRIHSSQSDIDPGIAACIIGSLAFACEQYEKTKTRLKKFCNKNNVEDEEYNDNSSNNKSDKPESAAPQLITDRRFEQLIECVISGVNINKRKQEFLKRDKELTDDGPTNIEEILDEEGALFDEGLNIRDACRAAWGIAILDAHHMENLGGAKLEDLFLALSLRVRELLLARLQELRQGDILSSVDEKEPLTITTEERLNEMAEELAEDAASAMWAFGCVQACTGISSSSLFETCCSILCHNPVDLRRRAQEADYEPSKNPILGSSDVIDRLARSEAAANNDNEEDEVKNQDEVIGSKKYPYGTEKDAFLDWLSPIEVTDLLWALALHGSNVTSSFDDVVTLSETASTLRETAYDRLVEWLEEDLSCIRDLQLKSNLETSSEAEMDEAVTVVEVVDAATLLASDSDEASATSHSIADSKPTPTESISLKTCSIVSAGMDSQEVEVVDAAKLLASTDIVEEGANIEKEVMITPTSFIENKSIDSKRLKDDRSSVDKGVDFISNTGENNHQRIFSSHDLASIAWSVTELRDPLRTHIVGLVIESLWGLGPNSVSSLSGTDLSNLAWAIAKYEGNNHVEHKVPITRWISGRALQRTRKYPLLNIVTPHELGRMMWSIACTTSRKSSANKDTGPDTSSFSLSRNALKAVSDHLSTFSIETLVRIAWAHIEINNSDLTVLDSFEMMALGKILATAEHSLHRWERVDFSTEIPSTESYVDSLLFSSFFGRPRRNLPILEQAVNDDDNQDDMDLAPLGRLQRPKLRDLVIDPSTLCKAACAFQRLSAAHPYLKGGWTFTRVAVRLLSSKNARLMKECSIRDIVRLCEAAVLSDTMGHGREMVIGLFSRQVVKLLNNVIVDGNQQDCSIHIGSASSSELSTLIWALGEMGVKHSPTPTNKNMRLVHIEPLLKHINVESLNIADLERLIRGLVLMNTSSTEQSFLLRVLKRINKQAPIISTGKEICTLAETIGILKDALNTINNESYNGHVPGSESMDSDEISSQMIASENISVRDELSSRSDDVLNAIAKIATESTQILTANEIRRLLEVYSLLPFQVDGLVDCLSEEISTRLVTLQGLRRTRPLDILLKNASRKSSIVRKSLFDDSSASLFSSIKAGIKSFFGSTNATDDIDQINDDGTKMTEEIASIIQESIFATSDAASRAEADQSALCISLDTVIQKLQEEASFELGRSLELIENYHRTEFSTGRCRSRHDRDTKSYISKRILSRLLP